MPDSPAEAKFLDKHDKLIAIERLRMNQTGVMSRQWRWDHFWETVRDVKTWLWFALIFSISYVNRITIVNHVLTSLTVQGSLGWRRLFRSSSHQVLRL